MTPRLTTNYAKNYCNRTLIVKVIVENVVTCFFWDTVYLQVWQTYLGTVWQCQIVPKILERVHS